MEIRFKLNPKNEKDQVIINVLSGEYSPSETIKNILYKMGTNGAEGQRKSFGVGGYFSNSENEEKMYPKNNEMCYDEDKLEKSIIQFFE